MVAWNWRLLWHSVSSTPQFKARVAVEAIAGHKTVNEIATEYGIHPSQVNKWKKQALERLPEAFPDGRGGNNGWQEEVESRLYQQIGRLTMELEYLKKGRVFANRAASNNDRTRMLSIEYSGPVPSAGRQSRQCLLRATSRKAVGSGGDASVG